MRVCGGCVHGCVCVCACIFVCVCMCVGECMHALMTCILLTACVVNLVQVFCYVKCWRVRLEYSIIDPVFFFLFRNKNKISLPTFHIQYTILIFSGSEISLNFLEDFEHRLVMVVIY